MKRYIDDHQIKNVIFTGFVSQKDISEVYTIADIFILPSQEEVR
jgi:glycosyltransferase involved in cell wall biosynthesis